jgi:putative colanic acid biosynthesis glycosyltransferase WcaI
MLLVDAWRGLSSVSRILIWSPNYAPELIGIPPLVTDAAEWLVQQGHDVDVVTALPNYPDRRIFSDFRGRIWRSDRTNGVAIHRAWLRVRPDETFLDKGLYEMSFAVISAPLVLRLVRSANVIVCLLPTLFTARLGGVAARATHTRLLIWIQDLVLAAAQSVAGVGRLQRRMLRALRSVESSALKAADRVISCSPGFVPYLIALGVDPSSVDVVPNWVDTDFVRARPAPAPAGPVRFLYSGNIGYTQAFETLFEARRLLADSVELTIAAGGNGLDAARRAGRDEATFLSLVPRVQYPALLASADVLVVVQRAVATNANLPSKIAGYLASGRPIVASIGVNSPAAKLLDESGAAIVVPPEDSVALADAMRTLRDDPRLRQTLGRAGRAFAVSHLDRRVILPRLEAAILGE